MIVLLIFSILALLLTYLEGIGKMKKGLWLGVFLVSSIAAIHYNFGSDYPVYFDNYKEFVGSNYSLKNVLSGDVVLGDFGGRAIEIGWVWLMYLVSPFGVSGFFLLVAIVSYFQGAVVYQLIKKYTNGQWMVFSLFIYLFNTSLYVGSMSGLRQNTAMAIIGCTIPFILNKKWIKSLGVVLAAFFIHKSAIIFAPFAFWGFISIKRRKELAFAYFMTVIVLYVFKDYIKVYLDLVFAYENFEAYQHYAEREKNSTYGIGFILGLIPAALSLIVMWKGKVSEDVFKIVSLATINFVLLPIANNVAMAERIAYYFQFISIIALPYSYGVVKNKTFRVGFVALFLLLYVYSYNYYFHLPERYSSTYIYHSLFDLL